AAGDCDRRRRDRAGGAVADTLRLPFGHGVRHPLPSPRCIGRRRVRKRLLSVRRQSVAAFATANDEGHPVRVPLDSFTASTFPQPVQSATLAAATPCLPNRSTRRARFPCPPNLVEDSWVCHPPEWRLCYAVSRLVVRVLA